MFETTTMTFKLTWHQ